MVLFLPQLREDGSNVPQGAPGAWALHDEGAFRDVATSLEIPSSGTDLRSVSSIPDMWARPLALEMALHDQNYPIRRQMIEQWRGMLAAIALSEMRGFQLKAELLQLAQFESQDPFARSLFQLLPNPSNALYLLPEDPKAGTNPWRDIYVFLWNDQAVGMTSPSTLICPSEDSQWPGLPWWEKEKRLTNPIPELNPQEKEQLWLWLKRVQQEVGNSPTGSATSHGIISGLVREFQNELLNGTGTPNTAYAASSNKMFFGIQLNRGVLSCLNEPIKALPRPSSVQIVPSSDLNIPVEQAPIIIPDPQRITQMWGQPAQNIWVHGTINLASLNPNQLPKTNFIREEDIFLPELFFVTQSNAFIGGLMPGGTDCLDSIFGESPISPLLPLNPRLLDYLTPEDLAGRMEFQQTSGYSGRLLRVILDLPLTGINVNPSSPSTYRVMRDYPLKEQNKIDGTLLPVLEIWPKFRCEGWKKYYGFNYAPDKKTFRVHFPHTTELNDFDGVGEFHYPAVSLPDSNSRVTLAEMSEFPRYVECRNKAQQSQGIILIKQPPAIPRQTGGTWKVGVDFGTSFTNVYIECNSNVQPLELESLLFDVTAIQSTRPITLREYFIADPMRRPLSTVVTTRGNMGETMTILDGRIYFPPDVSTFKPQADNWVQTNLKWSPDKRAYNLLFLRHLLLHISAQATMSNVREIQWSVSYPSAFSMKDISGYITSWVSLIKDLSEITPLSHVNPTVNKAKQIRTESIAVAQYFADYELPGKKPRLPLVRTSCLDIGGGSTDISVWEENRLIHQCSVQLAGKDIFSQMMQANPGFLQRKFKQNLEQWNQLVGFSFYAKLDVFMSRESEGWLRKARDEYADDGEFLGLMQLMALGLGGIYHYVGLILKTLHGEQKYKSQKITSTYLAGNGSRLVHWLAEGGQFRYDSPINLLFTELLSRASGFDNNGEYSEISPSPKDEVACGLVLGETSLRGGIPKDDKDTLISGEKCIVNGKEYDWNQRLEFDDEIESFRVETLTQLHQFLNHYHQAIKQLGLADMFPPIENYNVSDDISDNDALFSRISDRVTEELLKMIGDTKNIRIEPPFIVAVKGLLTVLRQAWSNRYS